MSKNEKCYRIISIVYFIFHTAYFIFLIVCGFFPYKENMNFYENFFSYFGIPGVSVAILLCLPLLASVFAFLAIRHPAFSIGTFVFCFAFSMLILFPYLTEVLVVGFPFSAATMPDYQIGFRLYGEASNILFLDIIFPIYAIITLILRLVAKSRAKSAAV